MTTPSSLGRHVLAELHGCPAELLNDVTLVERCMVEAARAAGASIDNTSFHHFAPHGVSGVVVIQESHLAIHTWPEFGFAAVDIFTCGSQTDPWAAHRSLKESLRSTRDTTQEIQRGLRNELDAARSVDLRAHPSRPGRPYSRNIWFTERADDIALSLRHEGCLFRRESAHQKVEVLDTTGYGRMLVLDDTVMLTERDEFVYHEMITHVPALVHADPKTALVIGGGDGGAARELLKHDGIEAITVVEIDAVVVEAVRAHFPEMARSLDDPRVDLILGDGAAFVDSSPAGTYDLVIVDSTEPKDIASALFGEAFYANVSNSLRPGGIVTARSEPPVLDTDTFRSIYDRQRAVFAAGSVHCYLAFIPTYTTGMISFSFAAKDGRHPVKDLRADRLHAFTTSCDLRYYNPNVHRAAFALPGFVRDLLGNES